MFSKTVQLPYIYIYIYEEISRIVIVLPGLANSPVGLEALRWVLGSSHGLLRLVSLRLPADFRAVAGTRKRDPGRPENGWENVGGTWRNIQANAIVTGSCFMLIKFESKEDPNFDVAWFKRYCTENASKQTDSLWMIDECPIFDRPVSENVVGPREGRRWCWGPCPKVPGHLARNAHCRRIRGQLSGTWWWHSTNPGGRVLCHECCEAITDVGPDILWVVSVPAVPGTFRFIRFCSSIKDNNDNRLAFCFVVREPIFAFWGLWKKQIWTAEPQNGPPRKDYYDNMIILRTLSCSNTIRLSIKKIS